MNESLVDLLIENLQQKTSENLLSWRIADRNDSAAVRRQFDLCKNKYGIPSPEEAYLCRTKAGNILLLKAVRLVPKAGSIIRAEYEYRLLVQPDGKGDYLDVSEAGAKLNQALEKLTDLGYDLNLNSEEESVYPDAHSGRISRFIFSVLSRHD
jgi:hypothetical protein